MLQPTTKDAVGRSQAMQLIAEPRDDQGGSEHLTARLRELAEE